MPLIIVTGLPSSGKSKVAQQIYEYIMKRLDEPGGSNKSIQNVVLVSDTAKLNKEVRVSVYHSINREKELRGWLKTQAQRDLSKGDIVILDAACYIKGFRYELFCVSKEASTQYCVVECCPPVEVCWKRNNDYLNGCRMKCDQNPDSIEGLSTGYDKATFYALIERYEKCNQNDRWDSPLFSVGEDGNVDLEGIYASVTQTNPLNPNKSTATTTVLPVNFMHELNERIGEVINTVVRHQKLTGTSVGKVKIDGCDTDLKYTRTLSHADLCRLKRQFISYTKLHPIDDAKNIKKVFVQYLNSLVVGDQNK